MKVRVTQAYSILSALLVADIVVQFFVAGAAVFTFMHGISDSAPAETYKSAFEKSDQYWMLHAINGSLLLLESLILVIVSFAARKRWSTTGLSALFIPLIILQAVLAHPTPAPYAGLHTVNGLLILGLGLYLTRREWAFGSRRSAPAQTVVDEDDRLLSTRA